MSNTRSMQIAPFTMELAAEQETQLLGQSIAAAIQLFRNGNSHGVTLHLQGELGAGKSTLARALLRALGVQGAIKSPTYALIEPYETQLGLLLHLDLYRLSDPGELEYLGVDELFQQAALCIIEWPEKAASMLPICDLKISLSHTIPKPLQQQMLLESGRFAEISPHSPNGSLLLANITSFFSDQSLVKSGA